MSLLTTSDHHLWPCHHLQPPLHDATPSHHCSHHPIHCCCIYYCCTKSTHQHPPSASHQLKWCIKTHHLGPVCFFCYYVFNFTDSFFVCFFFPYSCRTPHSLLVSHRPKWHQNALFGPSMFLLLFNVTNSLFVYQLCHLKLTQHNTMMTHIYHHPLPPPCTIPMA